MMALLLVLASLVLFSNSVNGQAPTVNPANQAAAKIAEARINEIQTVLASRNGSLLGHLGCTRCAMRNLQGAIVRSDNRVGIPFSNVVPATVTCNAEPGFSYSCSLAGGGMEVDGTWAIGDVEIGRYDIPRLHGTPVAEGRFRLTVRNFNAHWNGAFRQRGSRFSAAMACRDVPIRPDVDFGIGVTRTSGSESPEFTPLIEELARQAINRYYCDQANGRLRQPFDDALLRGGYRFRMTWGSL